MQNLWGRKDYIGYVTLHDNLFEINFYGAIGTFSKSRAQVQ